MTDLVPVHRFKYRVDVILKDPTYNDSSGKLFVNPADLEWGTVPLVEDPAACRHTETVCYECANQWGIDHLIRIFADGVLIWSTDEGNPFAIGQ